MRIKHREKESFLFLISLLILLFPALLIHLGLMPFMLDEATRANVALEMIFSDNYIVPTINGEYYYNKPPLFNWIQIFFTRITGNYSEFTFRLPVVVSLLFFGFTVYKTQRKELGKPVAMLVAFAVITSGRILFYDSFHGLIDITFSWLIYMIFWAVYYFHKRKDEYSLFMLSYLFASLAFLMKGLPALVFLGITLLVFYIDKKQFRKLFTLQHLSGIAIFVAIAGAYFFAYSRYHSLQAYAEALWSESAKRTFLDNPVTDTLLHLLRFPMEFIYHFLPWALFILVLFQKGRFRFIQQNKFTRYLSLVFIFNILIYWVSPAIYARYLFMFLPLFFGVIFHAYYNYKGEKGRIEQFFLRPLIHILAGILVLAAVFFPFFMAPSDYSFFWIKYVLIILLLAILVFYRIRNKRQWVFILIAFMLITRIAFNLFVLPDRLRTGTSQEQKAAARVTGELTRGSPLYLYRDTRIHHVSTFYIMRERKRILKRKDNLQPEVYYIVEAQKRQTLPPHSEIYRFETRIEGLQLSLIKLSRSVDDQR